MRILVIALLVGAAFSQVTPDAPSHFLIEMTLAPDVDVMHLTQPQMDIFQQHGMRLMKLRDEGVVVIGGHTDDPKNMRAIVIVKAKDIAAARALAANDPDVKAGLLNPSVAPFTLAIPPK